LGRRPKCGERPQIVTRVEAGVRFDEFDCSPHGAADRARFRKQFMLQAANHPEAWSFLKDHDA
jgi:hypothetical protein